MVVAVQVVILEHQRAAQAVAVLVMAEEVAQREPQILAAVAVVAAALGTAEHRRAVALEVPALSSSVTQTHLQQPHQPQARPQSLLLVATVSINGQVQGALHSDGTLCKT